MLYSFFTSIKNEYKYINIMAEEIDASDERAIMKYYVSPGDIESDERISNVYALLCKYIKIHNNCIVSYNRLCEMLQNDKYTKCDMIKYRPIFGKPDILKFVVKNINMLDETIRGYSTLESIREEMEEMRQLTRKKYKYE